MSQTLPVSQFRNMGSFGISIHTSHGPATNARTAYMTLTGYISFSLWSAIIKDSGLAMRKAQTSVSKYRHFRSWPNWRSFAGAQVVCFSCICRVSLIHAHITVHSMSWPFSFWVRTIKFFTRFDSHRFWAFFKILNWEAQICVLFLDVDLDSHEIDTDLYASVSYMISLRD